MIGQIQARLQEQADPAKKEWWENYVKGATFRGTTMAQVRAVVADFVTEHDKVSVDELKGVARELIAQPLSDDKLAGILLLGEHLMDSLDLEDLAWMRELFEADYLPNWDSCDWFCVKVLGPLIQRSEDPQRVADELISWTTSDELWLRRAGLVAFVNLAPKGDAEVDGLTRRVLEGARNNVADSRRFAQTSVWWTLRELSKADPGAVEQFVGTYGHMMTAEARRAATAKLKVRSRAS